MPGFNLQGNDMGIYKLFNVCLTFFVDLKKNAFLGSTDKIMVIDYTFRKIYRRRINSGIFTT